MNAVSDPRAALVAFFPCKNGELNPASDDMINMLYVFIKQELLPKITVPLP